MDECARGVTCARSERKGPDDELSGETARESEIVVLDVPDEWEADDPELVAMLDRRIREELARWDVEVG
jgi:predicted protein tyrosine phosphatase